MIAVRPMDVLADMNSLLPLLLGLAWLLPLASFVLIVFFGPRMGKARPLRRLRGHRGHHGAASCSRRPRRWCAVALRIIRWLRPRHGEHAHAAADRRRPISGDWYALGQFGSLRITIGYYIDALTLAMFCMVTLVASCIHVYSFGYMHDELHDVTDHAGHAAPTASRCAAAAASTASSSTSRCSASACWGW